MTTSKVTAGLTMQGDKRAADPRTLFRPGGKSIGELAKAIPVPADIPVDQVPEFRMDAFLSSPAYAAKAARERAKFAKRLYHPKSHRLAARDVDGFPPPGGHPQSSARVAGVNSRPSGASEAGTVASVSSRDCRGASRVPDLSGA